MVPRLDTATVGYGGDYAVTYAWDPNVGAWRRSVGGSPFVTRDGQQLVTQNVVVLWVEYEGGVGTDGAEARLVGEGKAAVLRGARGLLSRPDRPAILFEHNPITLTEAGASLGGLVDLLPDYALHYVDEGPRDGRPVVLVHGNPTWGYLYREFIPALVAGGNRAIVPDHLGFGRSAKPPGRELYRVPRHARRLEALLESLDLQGAVLVAHDWGGPIGLFWATRHPHRVDGLFLINTLAHGLRREMLPAGKSKLHRRHFD